MRFNMSWYVGVNNSQNFSSGESSIFGQTKNSDTNNKTGAAASEALDSIGKDHANAPPTRKKRPMPVLVEKKAKPPTPTPSQSVFSRDGNPSRFPPIQTLYSMSRNHTNILSRTEMHHQSIDKRQEPQPVISIPSPTLHSVSSNSILSLPSAERQELPAQKAQKPKRTIQKNRPLKTGKDHIEKYKQGIKIASSISSATQEAIKTKSFDVVFSYLGAHEFLDKESIATKIYEACTDKGDIFSCLRAIEMKSNPLSQKVMLKSFMARVIKNGWDQEFIEIVNKGPSTAFQALCVTSYFTALQQAAN